MAVIDVELISESQERYLTYALSVVTSRALPDVRDGLKPVQRRILYAMINNLRLSPERPHRKSAAVVGEVLARYHPHGDSACYEAMVRMAQDFSLRYPLVDGQGNFGSLDGDSAAAYRYTEARLTSIALEVIGDIGQETVAERDNFDQTVLEPVVLPSRVPNLLMNGASGIAVGMATAIPPHNLTEIIKALLLLLRQEAVSDAKIFQAIKGPDFPTGCIVLNTKEELKEIYKTGRGPIRMQSTYKIEKAGRGKELLVITSIPYGVDKSVLVEKIADLIIARKVPQLNDVRDESTDEIRIVLELVGGVKGANAAEKAIAYLFKHTTLQTNFNVNLTALVPSGNPFAAKPTLLSLRAMLEHFVTFRVDVTRAKLTYEKGILEARIHLLEGLASILDIVDEVIRIVRKSAGRSDAAKKLMKGFSLSEKQAFFIVDLRIYQLSKTSIEEVTSELDEKLARVKSINRLLKNKKALREEVAQDLERVSKEYGDSRRSPVVSEFEEREFDEESYVEHEDVFVIVTSDGWLKRIRNTNDPQGTRIREGDTLFFVNEASTRDILVIFTNMGDMFGLKVFDLMSTSGFGEPVQKKFRFRDGEQIVDCELLSTHDEKRKEFLFFSERGYGFRMSAEMLGETKKTGKRLMKVSKGDRLGGVVRVEGSFAAFMSEQGYGLCFPMEEITELGGAGKGVILQKIPKDDKLAIGCAVEKKGKIEVVLKKGSREVSISEFPMSRRALRGNKVIKRGGPVMGRV